MSRVTLQIVSGLIEVSHPGDMILPGLAQDSARVVNDHGCVPQGVTVLLVPLQDG